MRIVFFVILSVVLMVADHRAQRLRALRDALSTLVYPIQWSVNAPIRWAHELAVQFAARDALVRENARLRTEILIADSRLERMSEVEAQNRRLRALLGAAARLGDRVRLARIMAVDMGPSSHRIVLDQGSTSGVYRGQPVIDAQGIMGQVVQVSPYSSSALLITDPSDAVPVQVQRTGLRSVAVGTGEPERLKLLHITNNADVRVGDLVVSSGLGGRFPEGYPVGRIAAVDRDRGRPFATVWLTPSARLARNREVLLVWPSGRRGGPAAPAPSGGDRR